MVLRDTINNRELKAYRTSLFVEVSKFASLIPYLAILCMPQYCNVNVYVHHKINPKAAII